MCGIKDIHFHIRSAVYKHFFLYESFEQKRKTFYFVYEQRQSCKSILYIAFDSNC